MLVQNTLSFLRQLAFAETIAEKMLEPNTNGAVVMPEGNAVIKFSTSDHSNLDGIVKMIIIALQKTDKNVAASHVDGDDKKDATTTTTPVNNNNITNDTSAATVTITTTTTITSEPSDDDITTTTKLPSTPASECSQADTEICKASSLAKEEED
jgi:hypothetical protein